MNLIYLIGAGRSGTTILSLLLGNSDSVTSLGELHQLPEHMGLEGKCSCGQLLSSCPYWSSVYSSLHNQFCSNIYKEQARELESHRYVYKYLFSRDRALNYLEYRNATKNLFYELPEKNKYTVDSAKYIGRGLALNSIFKNNVQFIYLVRDPRGVVNSFGKKVQTSRGWFSATAYYLIVNFTALLVCKTLLRSNHVKVRYEDLINDPDRTLTKLAGNLEINLDEVKDKLSKGEGLRTGHLIGGNRLVQEPVVHFKNSDTWWTKMPRWKRWLVWLFTMPLNIANGYKP